MGSGDDITTARKLVAQDRFSEALQACDEILMRQPDNAEVTALKTWLLASPMPEVSDPGRAIALGKEAAQRHPNSAEVRLSLAGAYEAAGEYGHAVKEYKSVLALRPNNVEAYLALALLVQAPGSGLTAEEAVACLERGVATAPLDWRLRRELACLLWRLNDTRRAAQEYAAALGCSPVPDEDSRSQIEEWLNEVRAGVSFERGFLRRA